MILNKNKKFYSNGHHEIWTYSLLIIASILAGLLAVRNMELSPDSMRYALVSQQIISGNGIRTPMFPFNGNMIPIDGTVPFIVQPPLLPILLAILGGVTPQDFSAAQLLNLFSYIVISIFIFLLMKNLYGNWIALLTAILVSFSFPLLRVTHMLWSETLFIALTITSIYFLSVSRHSHHFRSYRLLSGIFASAAILTRYIGIAIIPVIFWEAFMIKYKKIESKFGSIILSITIPIFTIVVLFIRNYLISGTIRGFSEPISDRSFVSTFIGTIKILFGQFSSGKYGLSKYISILFMIFLISFGYIIFMNRKSRKKILKFINSGLDLIFIFIISYMTLIIVAVLRAPHLERRYTAPLVPFLFIISIFLIVFIWDFIKIKEFYKLGLLGLLLSLSIIAFINFYITFYHLSIFSKNKIASHWFLNSCTYNYIMENYEKDVIIATNLPFQLSFFGGYSSLRLPNKHWYKNWPIPENMESILPNRMSEIGARSIALFMPPEYPDWFQAGKEGGGYGKYVSTLFNKRENNDRFKLVHECSDGVVYELKE